MCSSDLHGGGSGAAYPVARDVLTFLYDKQKAMEVLEGYEKGWGGNIQERMDAKMEAYRNKKALEKAMAAGQRPPEQTGTSAETPSVEAGQ